MESEYAAAALAVVDSAAEVSLIAPGEVGRLAGQAALALREYEPGAESSPDNYINVRGRLLRAMIADLDDPGSTVTPMYDSGHQGDPAAGGGG